jgi:hypothetical protein
VRACLDDLVIALYVIVDELLGPDPRAGRPRRSPRLSDAELVCLAVAQVLLGCPGEHRWLRFCYGRPGHLFPYLPTSPATTNGCARPAGCWTMSWRTWPVRPPASTTPSGCWTPPRSPAPPRGRPSSARRCAGGPTTAGVPATRAGTGGSSCICSPPPTAVRSPGAWPAPSWASGRSPWRCWTEAASSPVRSSSSTRAWPGSTSPSTWPGHQARLLRPDRGDEPARLGSLRPVCQWIESIIDTLKGQLGLEQHGGRTPAGVQVRVVQRLLALATCVWFNW